MRIFEVKYELVTPLIISRTEIGNVLHNEYEYLPGSTIRGSALTEFMRDGYDVRQENTKPTMIFHPAFPIDNDNNIYKPSHPFIYKCKICKSIEKIDPYCIKSPDDIKSPTICKDGHPYALKSLGSRLISEKVVEYKPKYTILESVGINRKIKSSEIKLLYSYVALEPNIRFRGLIIYLEDNNLELDKLDTIFIGKGVSRGFGEVKVTIKEINNYYDKRKEEISRLIKSNDKTILKVLSPTFNITFNRNENRLVTDDKVNINGLKPKFVLMNGKRNISGFSMLSGIPKISLQGIKEGSLLYFSRIDADQLVDVELKGIGYFSCAGFNMVEVI